MAAKNLGAALDRVRVILETTRERDGQGDVLQEVQRRKAYQAAINRALAEIDSVRPRTR